MKTHPQHPDAPHAQARDDRFDAAMRELHRNALANVSPQVRWKLRPATRPQGGVGGLFRHWRRGPLLAGAGMAVLALALGMALWPRDESTTAPTAAATGAEPAPAAADDAFVLAQDPDFYAWLASDDAELVAME